MFAVDFTEFMFIVYAQEEQKIKPIITGINILLLNEYKL